MVKPLKVVRLIAQAAGMVGSLFVKRTIDGKYEIAIASAMVIFVVGSAATCAVQDDEPFHKCVKTTISMFKEVADAN